MTSGHMDYGIEPGRRRHRPAPELRLLPPAQQWGGKPLLEALKARRSCREFSQEELPVSTLSNLLWAAFGVNRPDTGGRTAPSAHDWEEIDLFVASADGLYLYDAEDHALKKRLDWDLRSSTGLQPFVAVAPLDFIYVADLSRMSEATAEEKAHYAGPDAGFISQNVYLFCASEGLATVVRGMVDRPRLAKLMGLSPQQRIILAQSVGYPAIP